MTTPDQPIPADSHTDHATERPGGVRGWHVLVMTFAIIVAVPLITIASLHFADRHIGEPEPLSWANRASWQVNMVQGTSLERGPMSSARNNQTYFELDSPITPEQEQAVWRCGQLLLQPPELFADARTGEALREAVAEHPELFYTHYALAMWARQTQAGDVWEQHMAEAMRLAPRCLVVPLVGAGGEPVANRQAGSIRVSITKVIDDEIDESLALPFLLWSDDLGLAYLPLYAGKYRVQGFDLNAPGTKPIRKIDGWFAIPGQVSRLPGVRIVE